MIPIGTNVYNVGSAKGRGAVFCRSAGTYAVVVSKDDETSNKDKGPRFVTVRLQSGEVRKPTHPHGGGRGKSKGNVDPVSPWGQPAKGGYKTRKVRKPNKWVVTLAKEITERERTK
ncbi:hypothetical protein DID88_001333 [Monilinia fructigena]|uniref:Large ribosomal subunit protein uL2 C-terminal domain-containing protein n=1 Tax=Monilinia fructigena TaxID=38457 RepID=A0A395IY68_9HELO|nr:hypothetical protein DID88_001333 [Monilinia fructigena]